MSRQKTAAPATASNRNGRSAHDNGVEGEPGNWSEPEDLRWAARHWATRIEVKPAQIHLRPMKTKWGSVSQKKRLTLDTGLLALPRELAEYVIVHELVHFLAPNHGKLFQSFLFAYLPDWEQRQKKLQEHARKSITSVAEG